MTKTAEEKKPFVVVAIDGGAASGKSSTSKAVAKALNLLHVDTGTDYRGVTHVCLQAGLAPEENDPLKAFLEDLDIGCMVEGRESRICFNGNPPLAYADLKSDRVNKAVSAFAALPVVRNKVKANQRNQVSIARELGFSGIIMDGRDIGTVILPDADLKLFLTADPSTRQKRRKQEGSAEAILDRDSRDATRATSPLKAAADAIVIDNSNLGLAEVVDHVVKLVESVRV